MNKFFYHLIFLIIGVGIWTSCKETISNQTEEPNYQFCLNEFLKESTQILSLSPTPIVEQITLTGQIDYNQNELIAFSSLIEGVIENIYFELGDKVKKGQVLASVRSTEIQDYIQQRKIFLNQLNLLNNQLQTKKELLQTGFSSLPEIQSIENEIDNTKIQIQKIDQTLALFNVNSNTGIYQILAPRDGFIVQKNMNIGENIHSVNEPLFAISNLNKIWVMVNIYPNNLRYIKTNDIVIVKTMAYPDLIYRGKINKIYNTFDNEEHVLKARVELDNYDMNLIPGLSADIIIDKGNSSELGFAIPNQAVIFHNNKYYVIVYKSDCDLQIKKINPHSQNETYTYVSTGFSEGDKIITSNALLIFEELDKQ